MAIVVDFNNSRIDMTDPTNDVTVQELVNAIRAAEDSPVGINYPGVADLSGKEDLGGSVYVGITMKLLNWKLRFPGRGSPTVCTVTKGNVVAVDGAGDAMDAIEYASNATAVIAQSTSAAIVGGGVTLEDGTITASKYDQSTAFPIGVESSEVADSMIKGTVDNTVFTPTTTQFEVSDITEDTANHYKGRVVLWITGNLKDQVADVTAYLLTGGRGHFTVSTMTEAPANGDTFRLV